ncbi:MAG: C25 family cysteine peptidase, partial [Thermoplasmatota archaeon]
PTSGFRSTHAAALSNNEKLPVLLTEACSPFKFSASDNCLGWSFVSNPDGGAIAGFGATGLSWGSSGTSVVSYLTSKVLIDTLKSYKQDGAITLGEMWTMGITKYYHPSMDGGEHKSVEEWHLLGDPSLSIAEDSSAPLKPNAPQGPSSGKPDETYEYSAVTTDPEGDDVYYLFDWGDGTDSGWLGPFDSGKACESSYTWTQKGTYAIRVKAQDFHGVVSDWSDPLEVSMPRSRALSSLLKDRYPSIFNIITSLLSI